MQIELSLFGSWRDMQPASSVTLDVPAPATVASLRESLRLHAEQHWPGFSPGLLAASVFASTRCMLRDDEPLPTDGQLAVLPPVSGG